MKHYNLKQLTLILLLSLFSRNAISQSVCVDSPSGAIILINDEFPKKHGFLIKRTDQAGKEVIIDEISGPQTKADLVNNHNAYAEILDNLLPLSDSTLNLVWDYYLNHENMDSLLVTEVVLARFITGLGVIDTTALDGSIYQYEVISTTEESGKPFSEKAIYKDFRQNYSIFGDKYEYLNEVMSASWVTPKNPGLYYVKCYRKENFRGTFTEISPRINYSPEGDSVSIYVTDTTIAKHQLYEYQLVPIDIYGNEGPPSEINQTISFSKDDFPVLQSFKTRPLDNRQMEVSWEMEVPPFLKSFELLRSLEYDGDYISVSEIPVTDTSYIDVIPIASEAFYYRLIINGPLGVSDTSVMTFGIYQEKNIPNPPVDVIGNKSNGYAEIKWRDNETNTNGFYVYRRKTGDAEWTVASPLLTVDSSRTYSFIDSTNVVNEITSFYYAIKSSNDSYLLSPFSDSITITLSSSKPLITPSNLKVVKEGENALISWQDMTEIQPDIMFYRLYRQSNKEDQFKLLSDTIKSFTNHYEDRNIEKGFIYAYKVQAVSIDGKISGFSPLAYTSKAFSSPIPPSKIYVTLDGSDPIIRWSEVRMEGIELYKVYIETLDDELVLTEEINADRTSQKITLPPSSKKLKVSLSTVNRQGIESPRSKSVLIK